MTDTGYIKGQSDNLPIVDTEMMIRFFKYNTDYVSAEFRGVKASNSARECYGDNAIGQVQLKREGDLCTVKAMVTPEHKLRTQAYTVICICNEKEDIIVSIECQGCLASKGGCKHAVAFLTWLNRRTLDDSRTSVKCYWAKSKLSKVGSSIKFVKLNEFGRRKTVTKLPAPTGSFMNRFIQHSTEHGVTCTQSTNFMFTLNSVEQLSLHYLSLEAIKQHIKHITDLLHFFSLNMTEKTCREAEIATNLQSNSALWFQLRYARITASKAYEAAHCQTLDGALVEAILGAVKLKDNAALKRGRKLEDDVVVEVGKLYNQPFKKTGLILHKSHPLLGASPDAVSMNFVLEVKCPMQQKNFTKFIKDRKPCPKYLAQIQMQMHFCAKKRGIFCVADADFESTKKITTLEVDYDEEYCLDLIEKCNLFWSRAIFPRIMELS